MKYHTLLQCTCLPCFTYLQTREAPYIYTYIYLQYSLHTQDTIIITDRSVYKTAAVRRRIVPARERRVVPFALCTRVVVSTPTHRAAYKGDNVRTKFPTAAPFTRRRLATHADGGSLTAHAKSVP